MGRLLLVGLGLGLALATGGTVSAQVDTGKEKPGEVRAKVVRVDPDKNLVVLRVGDGEKAKDVEYKVDKATRYIGSTKQPLTDGLRYAGFKEGTEVWFRVAPGTGNQTLAELRLNYLDTSPGKER